MKSASRHRVLPGLSEILATGPPLHSISLNTMFIGLTPGRSQVSLVPMPKLVLMRPRK